MSPLFDKPYQMITGPIKAPTQRLANVLPTNVPRLLTPQRDRLTGDINTFFVPSVKAMMQLSTMYTTNLQVSSLPFLTIAPMAKKQMGDCTVTNLRTVCTVKLGPITKPTTNLEEAYTNRNANDVRVYRRRDAPNTNKDS